MLELLRGTIDELAHAHYLGPELVTEGRSLILCGPSGTGKTHLGIAVAYRAIQNGYEALFTSAAEMIETLSVATRRGELAATLARYTHPAVLVIDEVGCAPRSAVTPCGMRGPPVTVAAVTRS